VEDLGRGEDREGKGSHKRLFKKVSMDYRFEKEDKM